ncbi:hypothetical protein D3C78_1909490 [compost metagenome]
MGTGTPGRYQKTRIPREPDVEASFCGSELARDEGDTLQLQDRVIVYREQARLPQGLLHSWVPSGYPSGSDRLIAC